MKIFRNLDNQSKDYYRTDEKLSAIVRGMAAILQQEAIRKGFPPDFIDAMQVGHLPCSYQVWSGTLKFPWPTTVQEGFRKLARQYRFRFNEIHAIMRDQLNITNSALFGDGGVGGIAGQQGKNPTVTSVTIQGDSVEIDSYLSAGQTVDKKQAGAMTSAEIDYLTSSSPNAVDPQKGQMIPGVD